MAENTSSKQDERDATAIADGLVRTIAGLGKEFAELPDLQRALVSGAARSGERERERLRGIYGDKDPRVVAAGERLTELKILSQQVDATLDYGTKAAGTLNADNLFHGYLIGADGTPASKYQVRVLVLVRDDRIEKDLLTGTTGDDGYFSIELPFSGACPDEGEEDPSGKMPGTAAESHQKRGAEVQRAFGAAPTAAKAPVGAVGDKVTSVREDLTEDTKADEDSQGSRQGFPSRVQVLDPAGCVVLYDPDPPVFTPPQSVFRHYVLGAEAGKDAPSPSVGTGPDAGA